jgi:hypothetical protein
MPAHYTLALAWEDPETVKHPSFSGPTLEHPTFWLGVIPIGKGKTFSPPLLWLFWLNCGASKAATKPAYHSHYRSEADVGATCPLGR